MLTNFFGKSNPINFIVLFVLILLYFCLSFFESFSALTFDVDFILKQIGKFGLALLYCFIFGFILSKNKLTLDNSYGFLILVTLFGVFPEALKDWYTLFFNILLLIYFRKILSFRTTKSLYEKLFDGGFWLSILFILEPFSLIFGILIYLSVSLFQKTNYQTIFIPVIGFTTPLIIYFTYCFWFDNTESFYELFYWYSSYDINLYLSDQYSIPLLLVGVFSVIALVTKTPKIFLISGSYRKYWIIISLIFLLSIIYLSLKNTKNGSELLIAFFPVSIMIANWIESIQRKYIKEIMVLLFILLPVVFFIV
jgi:hypothetical protein